MPRWPGTSNCERCWSASKGWRCSGISSPHTHAEYLNAFRAAGLRLEQCVEPALTAESVQAKRRASRHIPEATLAAYLGLPAVLVFACVRELAV